LSQRVQQGPILRSLEWVETLFNPLNPEKEFQAGFFRVPVPHVDSRAFREALANALKRIGLVERTGRGGDLIYRGMLRYGCS
jgi:ATP-dependent DNA helicase RecG